MRFPVFLAATLLATTFPLLADDTALNEGAYGPQPLGGAHGPESAVRMESEQLKIAFGKKWTEVHAKFVFRNAKSKKPIVQIVGFPDIGAAQLEARRRDPKGEKVFAIEQETPISGVLHGMRRFVNGQEQKSKLRYGWVKEINGIDTPVEKYDEHTGLMGWHALEVTFPPGQDVIVERRYRTETGGQTTEMPSPHPKHRYGINLFYYTTATGGVWQGTIGSLVADVTLEDGWTVNDLAWRGDKLPPIQSYPTSTLTKPDRQEWEILSPTHLRFSWKNFEPRTEKDHRGFEIVTKDVGTSLPQ
jgi:hypothetical protein